MQKQAPTPPAGRSGEIEAVRRQKIVNVVFCSNQYKRKLVKRTGEIHSVPQRTRERAQNPHQIFERRVRVRVRGVSDGEAERL
jgi:hypothetical protein